MRSEHNKYSATNGDFKAIGRNAKEADIMSTSTLSKSLAIQSPSKRLHPFSTERENCFVCVIHLFFCLLLHKQTMFKVFQKINDDFLFSVVRCLK